MQHFRSATLLILGLILIACSPKEREPQPDQVIVARVDDQIITETSFQRAYLPLLLYGDKFDSEQNREDMVNFLIGQKILAEQARKAELDTLTVVHSTSDRVERKALTRRLYQEWVRKKLKNPTETELREGFERGKKSIFARHLFAEDASAIKQYARRLKSGQENFYTLAQDVFSDTLLSRNGGALGWVTFGDLDETLEDTLYRLKPGQISEPVKSQYGWHILSMDDSREELFITEADYQENRDLIRNKIIERREQVLGKQVLNEFMESVDIIFERDITKQVWPIVLAHLHPKELQNDSPPEFSEISKELEGLRDEVLLYANREPWTVSQILARLPELERPLLYGNLYVAASNIIRDEMLVREARRLNLDEDPELRIEVRDAEEQVLSDAYVLRVMDTLSFTDDHLRKYFKTNSLTKYHAPDSLEVELFNFSDSLLAAKTLYQLRSGVVTTDPGELRMWISSSEPDLYRLTRSIAVGTMAGPVHTRGQWTLVKLLTRKRFPLKYEEVQERVRTDMERERFNSTRNILLADLRTGHAISIDHATLNH